MRCGRARTLLPLLLDGRLPPKDEKAMQRHLRSCDRCAHMVHSITSPLPPLPPVPDALYDSMHTRLQASLDARIQANATIHRRHHFPFRPIEPSLRPWARMSALIAGAMATGILLALTIHPLWNDTQPSTEITSEHPPARPPVADRAPDAPSTSLHPAPFPATFAWSPSRSHSAAPAVFFASYPETTMLGLRHPRSPWSTTVLHDSNNTTPPWMDTSSAPPNPFPVSE